MSEIKEKYYGLYLILARIDIEMISIFKLVKFKCWSIKFPISFGNIKILLVSVTAVVLVLIRNSVNEPVVLLYLDDI